ncbi:hypothetical protein ATCC90586_010427 [Pythium insidiosum]|nr:hypothetical protein ATCC90586_010427 [Pythium insidiosum]
MTLLMTAAFLWAFSSSAPASDDNAKPRSWSRRLSSEWVKRLSVVVISDDAPEPETEPAPQQLQDRSEERMISPRPVSSPVSFRKSSISLDDV